MSGIAAKHFFFATFTCGCFRMSVEQKIFRRNELFFGELLYTPLGDLALTLNPKANLLAQLTQLHPCLFRLAPTTHFDHFRHTALHGQLQKVPNLCVLWQDWHRCNWPNRKEEHLPTSTYVKPPSPYVHFPTRKCTWILWEAWSPAIKLSSGMIWQWLLAP